MRIELVGGLGVGKSTLCNALDRIGFHSIYETLTTNPFLADCFADPEKFRFPSQMWFVLSKFHEIRKFERSDRVNVLDQSVLNLKAYTNMLFGSADPEALAIINQCFAYLENHLGPADLLIHLKCSPLTQLRRIRGRGRAHEAEVGISYISRLQEEIDAQLAKAREGHIPIVDIDTEEINFLGNIEYAETLARRIAGMFHLDLAEILDPAFPRQYSLT